MSRQITENSVLHNSVHKNLSKPMRKYWNIRKLSKPIIWKYWNIGKLLQYNNKNIEGQGLPMNCDFHGVGYRSQLNTRNKFLLYQRYRIIPALPIAAIWMATPYCATKYIPALHKLLLFIILNMIVN